MENARNGKVNDAGVKNVVELGTLSFFIPFTIGIFAIIDLILMFVIDTSW